MFKTHALTSVLKKTTLAFLCFGHLIAWAAFDIGAHFSNKAAWGEGMKALQSKMNAAARAEFAKRNLQSYQVIAQLLSDRNEGITCIMPRVNFNGQSIECINLLGHSLYDVEIRYGIKKGFPLYMNAYVYTRGDATSNQYQEGEMSFDAFQALAKKVYDSIDKIAQKKPQVRSADKAKLGVRRELTVWHAAQVSYILDVNYTEINGQRRPEYIKVIMAGREQARELVDKYTKTPPPVTARALRRNTKKKRGEVLLPNIPMINQGQKGYCTAATTARVLQYYGRSLGMHDVAQIANTTAQNGTDAVAWFRRMEEVSPFIGVVVKQEPRLSITASFNDCMERYNSTAKRMGKPALNLARYGHMRNIAQILEDMDKEVLKEAKTTKDMIDLFMMHVKKNIDIGIPLVWSVQLGMKGGEEEGAVPQAGGGHTRLIIGYNLKEKKIYFSDTWGKGHDCKGIPIENAVYITTGLYMIYPEGITVR